MVILSNSSWGLPSIVRRDLSGTASKVLLSRGLHSQSAYKTHPNKQGPIGLTGDLELW